jgi:hypothetical protein
MDRRNTIFRYWRLANIIILTVAFFSPWLIELSALDVLFMALASIHHPTSIIGLVFHLAWPLYIILNGLKLQAGWTLAQAQVAILSLVLGSGLHLATLSTVLLISDTSLFGRGFFLALLGYQSSIVLEATERVAPIAEWWVLLGAILAICGVCGLPTIFLH